MGGRGAIGSGHPTGAEHFGKTFPGPRRGKAIDRRHWYPRKFHRRIREMFPGVKRETLMNSRDPLKEGIIGTFMARVLRSPYKRRTTVEWSVG